MRAYAVVMVTSLYHQKNGCSVLFSVRKADQEYLREYLEGHFYSFAISLLARIFRSSALTESLTQASLNQGSNIISRLRIAINGDPSSRIQETGYRRIGLGL